MSTITIDDIYHKHIEKLFFNAIRRLTKNEEYKVNKDGKR